ncbi:hypothetical protein Tco_1539461 [Tanacetum coccineum]
MRLPQSCSLEKRSEMVLESSEPCKMELLPFFRKVIGDGTLILVSLQDDQDDAVYFYRLIYILAKGDVRAKVELAANPTRTQFDLYTELGISIVTYSPLERGFISSSPKMAENFTDVFSYYFVPQHMVELESIASDDAAKVERYMDGFPTYLRFNTPPLSSWKA